MNSYALALCGLCLLLGQPARCAFAQDDLGLGIASAEADLEPALLSRFLDTQMRFERTVDIPGRSDDIERFRLRLRGGLVWTGRSGLELGAALEAQVASSSNAETRRNLDNERADQVLLDQLYLRYALSERSTVSLGKTVLPLTLTPLIWDADLRPIGVSTRFSGALSDFSNWHLDLGYFAPDHLFDDDSRLAALQVAFGFNEGAPSAGALRLSYLEFSDVQRLVDAGLGRTNRRIAVNGKNVYLSDYRLLDVIVSGRIEVAGKPLELTLDHVRNLGADDRNRAGRAALTWGDASGGGVELGFAYQRIQQDAVLAAFSEDDWWFHSFARGGMPWIGYGFSDQLQLRLAGFRERRDGVAQSTDRILLDVNGNW
jgi:hypothetical protein